MPALTLSRQPHRAPRAEWLRVLAGYLVAIFLLQGMAAAVQLGAGPLHRHSETPVTLATLMFAHHDHAHASGERHQHDAADKSVVVIAEAGPSDSMTSALCSALTLLAIGMTAPWAVLAQRGRPVQRAALPWARHATPAQALYRPPWLA